MTQTPLSEDEAVYIKSLIPKIESVTTKLDYMLYDHRHVAGDDVSIADFLIYC